MPPPNSIFPDFKTRCRGVARFSVIRRCAGEIYANLLTSERSDSDNHEPHRKIRRAHKSNHESRLEALTQAHYAWVLLVRRCVAELALDPVVDDESNQS